MPCHLTQEHVSPPLARRDEGQGTVMHGVFLPDEYGWMRDKTDPALLRYLEAENEYARHFMRDVESLKEELYWEMRRRIQEADNTVPSLRGGYLYWNRTEEGEQYYAVCRRRDEPDAPVEVVLDINQLARGEKFFKLGTMTISRCGRFVAYTVDTIGFKQYRLFVREISDEHLLPVTAERVTSVAWANDSRTIFYTTEDAQTKRSNKLYRHVIGDEAHELIHEEKDEFFNIDVARSRSPSFIYLITESLTTSWVSFVDADSPQSSFEVIVAPEHEIRYSVDDDGRDFFLLTNDGAKDFRVVKVLRHARARDDWQEIVPARDNVLVEDVDVFAHHLVVQEKEDGLTRLRVQEHATGDVHYITFPEPVYEVYTGPNYEFSAGVMRLGYQSMVTPPSTYDYDLSSRTMKLLKVHPVIGYDKSLYRSERIWATADDGVQVPISLVYKWPLQLDGSRVVHLYGYGAYGYGMPTTFSSNLISLLDRGIVFAIAHVRGGNELGEGWHDGGKMANKMKTFTDLIACAKHLRAEGYGGRISIEGGSAGGLLVGAVLNLTRGELDDLIAAAILHVPFLTVINTMADKNLPLTVGEYEEWGDPADEGDFRNMVQYSPYDNIVAACYPPILVRTALNDSQVMFWEPVQWAARMRFMKKGDNPLLLRTLIEAGGHHGASGRFDYLENIAEDYAYLLKVLKLV